MCKTVTHSDLKIEEQVKFLLSV